MKKTKSKEDKQEIQLEDILSLNIYQLVILFFLSVQLSETVRYTLLQDLNKYMFSKARLSASSFYNTLDRLEKLGLIETTITGGRTKSIRGTSKIKEVLKIVSQNASLLSFDPEVIFDEYLPIFEKYINLGKMKNILFIDMDEFFDIGIISLLKKHAEDVFILADNKTFEKYQNRSNQKIFQSQIINGKIREPDNIFDVVNIADYHLMKDYYGMDEKEVIKEAIRVTKQNGVVFINAQQVFPKIENVILESVIKNLNSNPFMITIEEKEFEESIKEVSPVKPEFYNSRGFLVAKIQLE